jgi:hypothetical protein
MAAAHGIVSGQDLLLGLGNRRSHGGMNSRGRRRAEYQQYTEYLFYVGAS